MQAANNYKQHDKQQLGTHKNQARLRFIEDLSMCLRDDLVEQVTPGQWFIDAENLLDSGILSFSFNILMTISSLTKPPEVTILFIF